MRTTILAAAAIAALLSIGTPANRATAMTVAAPSTLGLADASPVQQVRWGWHRHRYWGWHHRYWGWRHYYWGGPHYWGGPWYYPRPYYWARPWGPCCWWGWHRHWWW